MIQPSGDQIEYRPFDDDGDQSTAAIDWAANLVTEKSLAMAGKAAFILWLKLETLAWTRLAQVRGFPPLALGTCFYYKFRLAHDVVSLRIILLLPQ